MTDEEIDRFSDETDKQYCEACNDEAESLLYCTECGAYICDHCIKFEGTCKECFEKEDEDAEGFDAL